MIPPSRATASSASWQRPLSGQAPEIRVTGRFVGCDVHGTAAGASGAEKLPFAFPYDGHVQGKLRAGLSPEDAGDRENGEDLVIAANRGTPVSDTQAVSVGAGSPIAVLAGRRAEPGIEGAAIAHLQVTDANRVQGPGRGGRADGKNGDGQREAHGGGRIVQCGKVSTGRGICHGDFREGPAAGHRAAVGRCAVSI